MSTRKFDAFLCHASEDESTFVEPLAQVLKAFGLNIWYDTFSLGIGDSLTRSIDKGLSRSRFGIVVLSPAFFAKRWTEYELRGLNAKEMQGKKIILPIWHNVSKEQVLAFSPPLAEKVAIITEGKSLTSIAVSVIKIVKPELFKGILRKFSYQKQLRKAVRELRPPSEVSIRAPIMHDYISSELIARVRLIRAALLPAYPHSMKFWIEGFRRDLNIEREVRIWESIAAVVLEYILMTPLSTEQKKRVVSLVISISSGTTKTEMEGAREITTGLPEDVLDKLYLMYHNALPPYDIKDEQEKDFDAPGDLLDLPVEITDKKSKDIPDELVDDIIEENENDF